MQQMSYDFWCPMKQKTPHPRAHPHPSVAGRRGALSDAERGDRLPILVNCLRWKCWQCGRLQPLSVPVMPV